jgi:hypothetical protein
MANGYVIQTAGATTCTAATARTILAVTSTAANPLLTEIGVSCDGVTSTGGQVIVELNTITGATTGTLTAQTPVQVRGWPSIATLSTGRVNYTAEPGVQTITRTWLIAMNGAFVMQFPLGREPATQASTSFYYGVRVTAPSSVGVRGYLEYEE